MLLFKTIVEIRCISDYLVIVNYNTYKSTLESYKCTVNSTIYKFYLVKFLAALEKYYYLISLIPLNLLVIHLKYT